MNEIKYHSDEFRKSQRQMDKHMYRGRKEKCHPDGKNGFGGAEIRICTLKPLPSFVLLSLRLPSGFLLRADKAISEKTEF